MLTARTHAVRRSSSLYKLATFLDDRGIIRVGGRLTRAQHLEGQCHPIILPYRHNVTELIIPHYHKLVHHQGRQPSLNSIHQYGFWIVHGRSAVDHVIRHCVLCRRLRGKPARQQMAELPLARLSPSPPFNSVGVDVFCHWLFKTRVSVGTRRTSNTCKRWALTLPSRPRRPLRDLRRHVD